MAKRRRSSVQAPTTSTGSGDCRSNTGTNTKDDPPDENPPAKRRKIYDGCKNEVVATTEQPRFCAGDTSTVDYLSRLSFEMICQILEYLPIWDVMKLECQCRHLQGAVKLHLQLLTDIDFTEGEIHGWMPTGFNDNTLKCFLIRCPELMYIYGLHLSQISRRRQRGYNNLSIPGIIDALQQCDNLSGIETSNIFIMEGVLNYLPSVEIMGTFKNRDGAFPIPPQNSITLPRNPQLTSLHLTGIELKDLPRMDYLQRLHLKWVRFTDPHPFRECGMPSLRCFVMNNCAGPQNALKYVPLMTGLASARSLNRLELIRVPFLGGLIHHVVEDSWRVSGFRNLHKIKIGSCKHVQEADLGYLLITCKNKVEDLCIQPSLTKDSFFYSMTYAEADFTRLRFLHLGFVDDFPELGKWTTEELTSYGLAEYTDNPAFVTDFGMRCVARVFSHLTHLKLYNCPQLHNPTAWSVNGNNAGGFNHLTDLHLRRCHAIKLSEFSLFISSLPCLEHLCLEDMFKEPPKGCSRVGLSAGLGVSSALMGGPPSANPNLAPPPPANQAQNLPANPNPAPNPPANQNPAPNPAANQNGDQQPDLDEVPDDDEDTDDDNTDDTDGEIDVSVEHDGDTLETKRTPDRGLSSLEQLHSCGKSSTQSSMNNLAGIGTFSDERSAHDLDPDEVLDIDGIIGHDGDGELLEIDGYVWNNEVDPNLDQVNDEEKMSTTGIGEKSCDSVSNDFDVDDFDNSRRIHLVESCPNVPIVNDTSNTSNEPSTNPLMYDPFEDSQDDVQSTEQEPLTFEESSDGSKSNLKQDDVQCSRDERSVELSDDSDCEHSHSKGKTLQNRDIVCRPKGKSMYGAKKGLRREKISDIDQGGSTTGSGSEVTAGKSDANSCLSDVELQEAKDGVVIKEEMSSSQSSAKNQSEYNNECEGVENSQGQVSDNSRENHSAKVKGCDKDVKVQETKVSAQVSDVKGQVGEVKCQTGYQKVTGQDGEVSHATEEVKGQVEEVNDQIDEVKGKEEVPKPKQKKRVKRSRSGTGQKSGKKSTKTPSSWTTPLEDDHPQMCVVKSNSLLNLNLVHVGITDLVLTECKRLATVTVHACRVLKNVQMDSVPWLGRASFTQCPKLVYQDVVDEICQQPPEKPRLIFLRPINNYDAVKLERHILSMKTYKYHVCLIHDDSPDPEETLHNRIRVMGWPEVFSSINYELIRTHKHPEVKRVSDILQDRYPWRPGVYNMKGTNENGSQWDLVTDIPWIQSLASAPNKSSQNWLFSDSKAGVYSPSAKGHCSMQATWDELQYDLADIQEQQRPLFIHPVIIFINLCDIKGATPDFYA